MFDVLVVEGRRNRKPSRKILDLLESAGQRRPVSAILAAGVGPEVAAAVGPEVATAVGPEVAAARPEVAVAVGPEVAVAVGPEVTSGDRKRGTAAKRRSTGDGAGGTGIEEPLYKSVQVHSAKNIVVTLKERLPLDTVSIWIPGINVIKKTSVKLTAHRISEKGASKN